MTTSLPVLNKPKFGEPCNNCGLCCTFQVCEVGSITFGLCEAPCPALEQEGDRFYCGLVRRPAHYIVPDKPGMARANDLVGGLVEKAIGAGQGCGMKDDWYD